METTEYLGFRFVDGTRDEILDAIERAAAGPYGYVITPNVDFVTRAEKDAGVAALYDGAAMQLCDSRILARLAAMQGTHLTLHPGSDVVATFLDSRATAHRIALIGPAPESVALLRQLHPELDLTLIPTPRTMTPHSPEWDQVVAATRDAEWDVALLCLGSPKQERLAQALRIAGRQRGVALCVGASVDFLTGEQKRAPSWMRQHGLEWLHRLASNPRRLAKRYLLDGPRIFVLALRR